MWSEDQFKLFKLVTYVAQVSAQSNYHRPAILTNGTARANTVQQLCAA